MMDNMDIERYRALLEVLESGSISAAADKLAYTASGVSRMMAAIEEELGFTLLTRGKSGVKATIECERILPEIRSLVASADILLESAARVKGIETGKIVIATSYSCYYKWITEMISSFHELHPGIQFRIINGTSTDLVTKLEEKQLDFCIVSRREGDHSWIHLSDDHMVAMLPKEHPLSKENAVPMGIFSKEPYIETYPDQDIDNSRVFRACHIIPNTQFQTLDRSATYAMVEAGLGISLNNSINCQPNNGNVVHLPLIPDQIVEIGIAYSKEPTHAAKAFLDYIEDKLPVRKS